MKFVYTIIALLSLAGTAQAEISVGNFLEGLGNMETMDIETTFYFTYVGGLRDGFETMVSLSHSPNPALSACLYKPTGETIISSIRQLVEANPEFNDVQMSVAVFSYFMQQCSLGEYIGTQLIEGDVSA